MEPMPVRGSRAAVRYLIAATAMILAGCAGDVRVGDPDVPPGEWRYIGGDAAHTRYTRLAQVDASNFNK